MKLRASDFLLVLVAGLVLGAIVHIVVVLRLPSLARQDAFGRLALHGRSGHAELLPASEDNARAIVPGADPATATAVCAYDLSDGPLHVTAPASGLPQSLSLHERGGRAFYALTDRAAVRGQLDLEVMTQAQYDEALAYEDEEAPSTNIRVVAPSDKGLVVVRALALRPSLLPRAQEAATAVTCTREADDDSEQ